MEIDITSVVLKIDPFQLSGSAAEHGENASNITWQASVESALEITLLDTEEKREAFRDWVSEFGGWTEQEIRSWDNTELEALFHQWIAADLREIGYSEPIDSLDEIDWADVEAHQAEGYAPSNIFHADGKVYFSLSH